MAEQDHDRAGYNLEAIRQLVLGAFTAEELRRFCFDRPLFRPIVDNFGPKYNLNDMVDEVLFYCEPRGLVDQLVAEVRQVNPRQVARFEGRLRDPHYTGPAAATDQAPLPLRKLAHLVKQAMVGDTETARALRNRQAMLRLVSDTWVKGFLESSVHRAALIELGKEELAEAVERPWEMVVQMPGRPSGPVPPGTAMIELLEEMGGALLILGEPGSGKTITLLQLAREAIARAEADVSQPIPAVLHLSSWAARRLPLAEWLADELAAKYQIPKRIGRPWIEQDALLLLLDGLDEVDPAHRQACVEAINRYRGEHGRGGVVVCCRAAEYQALPSRLQLNGAILLQPLTAKQVDGYLAAAGPPLAGLRAAVERDPALAELAQTPLMLGVMALAYRDLPAESLAARRPTHLFAAYVSHVFQRRGVARRYTRRQTVTWLTWLAQRLEKHSQTVFLLEELQPSWLVSHAQRWLYALGSRAMGGLLAGLAILFFLAGLGPGLVGRIPTAVGLAGYLAAGLAIGLVDGIQMRRPRRAPASRALPRQAIRAVLIGLAAGLAFDLAAISLAAAYSAARGLVVEAAGAGRAFLHYLPNALLLSGLPLGLIWGLRQRGQAAGADIRTVEHLGWSWRRFLLPLLLAGLVPAAITLALAARAYEPGVRLWDGRDGRPLATLGTGGRPSDPLAATFSPDGRRLATAYEAGPVRLWDGRDGRRIASLEGSYARRGALNPYDSSTPVPDELPLFSPDGARVVTPGAPQTVLLWDSADGRLVARLEPDPAATMGGAWPIAFNRDGTLLLTGSDSGEARLWDGRDGQLIATLKGQVRSASFSPDGQRVLTRHSNMARLWDAADGRLVATLDGHALFVELATFSPAGSRILTYDEIDAFLWDGESGGLIAALGEEDHYRPEPNSAFFSPDDARLVTIGSSYQGVLWDGQDGSVITPLGEPFEETYSAIFSPDSALLATTHAVEKTQLREAKTGESIALAEGYAWSFSPDGSRLVTRVGVSTLRLWDGRDGHPIATLDHPESVLSASFCSDSKRLLTTGHDPTARLWDSSDGALLATLAKHKGTVEAAAFSPDGERIVTAGEATADYRPAAALWPLLGLAAGALGGLRGGVRQQKVSPNQGIRLTARNAALIALPVGLLITLLAAVAVWAAQRWVPGMPYIDLSPPLLITAFTLFAVLTGLAYGGLDVLQHGLLRGLLAASGQMPWRTVRFLDHASERILLRKVGGGYIFVHRLVMEYFASLAQESP